MNFLELSGARIKEERERLGLSQEVFAAAGGVKRVAQYLYERGARAPDTKYLGALYRIGVDVHYLVTGVRLADAPPIYTSTWVTLEEAQRAFNKAAPAESMSSAFRDLLDVIVQTRRALSPKVAARIATRQSTP